MNLFNDDNDKKKVINKGTAFSGDYEDVMKERAKQLPAFEKEIQEKFENYDGEMVAVIRIREDENGQPEHGDIFVGGVCSFESSMKMLKALDEAKDAITSQMAHGLMENPEALGQMMGGMLGDLIKKAKDNK